MFVLSFPNHPSHVSTVNNPQEIMPRSRRDPLRAFIQMQVVLRVPASSTARELEVLGKRGCI